MLLINESGFEARLFTGAIDDEQLGAWVVARATYAIDREWETLSRGPSQWPVFHDRVATPFGTFPSDNSPRHRGCDLVILGSVRCVRPTPSTVASVEVGDHARSIDVIGDRRWVRASDGSLVPSAPLPFTEMPVGWNRAFGGSCGTGESAGRHPLNAPGRGLYADERSAEGGLLPNLEDPYERIRAWSDAPTPAAWGPVARARPWEMNDALQHRDAGAGPVTPSELERIAYGCTDAASVPRNRVSAVRGGERVRVRLGDEAWSFRLPDCNLRVDVAVGAERFSTRTTISGLWFLADTQLLVVTFRSRWRYRMRPREERCATLRCIPRRSPTPVANEVSP